jgi:hypothetical protein
VLVTTPKKKASASGAFEPGRSLQTPLCFEDCITQPDPGLLHPVTDVQAWLASFRVNLAETLRREP